MYGEVILRVGRRNFLPHRYWVVLMNLAAITLLLVTYVVHTSQAGIPVEQAECDGRGRPGFGILQHDVGAVDIYSDHILSMAGCTSNGNAPALQGTPTSVHAPGLIEPKAER